MTISQETLRKFFGIFYNIFRVNSSKNFNFQGNNIIFIHVW